jgi:hypothetical protein
MAARGVHADFVAATVAVRMDRRSLAVRSRVDAFSRVGRGRGRGDVADRGDVVPVEAVANPEQESGPQEAHASGRGDVERDG